jgi:hypothetical protein
MLRHFTLAMVLAVLATGVAQAQSSPGGFIGVGSPLDLLQPLPVPPCDITGVVTGGSWNYCNSLRQWVEVYNQRVSDLNQIRSMQQQVTTYLHYPQSLPTYVTSDWQQLYSIAQRENSLNFTEGNVNHTVQQNMPQFQPGYDPDTMREGLENDYLASMETAMNQAGAAAGSSTIGRDTDAINELKTASANSLNPTEATQSLVQVQSIMFGHIARLEELSGMTLSEASSYHAYEVAKDRLNRQVAAARAQTMVNKANPAMPPPLTPSQYQALGLTPP